MSEGPSLQDMLDEVRDSFQELREKSNLPSVSEALQEINNKLAGFGQRVNVLRERNYKFVNWLEKNVDNLKKDWSDVQNRANEALSKARNEVYLFVRRAQDALSNAERSANETNIQEAQREIEESDSALDEAIGVIEEIYELFQERLEALDGSLDDIDWALEQKDSASFSFNDGESVITACKAEWVQTGNAKQDPDGVLYITNTRLIFEQKETTGKFLGLFGGKKEQEFEWAVEVDQITGIRHENKGMLGGKDMLYLTLQPGGKLTEINLEVKGGADNEAWAETIRRVQRKEYQ
jgi:hypothetical protein